MYSVVLMMALSSGAEVPAFGGRGCHGCHGGCHGGYAACHGGSACHGGYAGCHGCHGGLLARLRNRCHGCHGCHGGCHGCHAAHACHGGCAGCHGPVVVTCHGCHGGPGAPPPPPPKKGPEKVPAPKSSGGEKEEVAVPAPATIVVSLPAEAKLLIDDAATTSTSDIRVFASPSLEPGKDFYYTLKGELVRDGRTLTADQRVRVRAGEETRVQLEFPVISVALR